MPYIRYIMDLAPQKNVIADSERWSDPFFFNYTSNKPELSQNYEGKMFICIGKKSAFIALSCRFFHLCQPNI